MSLINEALKKAQRQRAAEAATTPADGSAPAGPVAKRSKALRAQTVILLVAGATVLSVFSVVVTVYWLNDTPAPVPTRTTAPRPPQAAASAPSGKPAAVSLPAAPATTPDAASAGPAPIKAADEKPASSPAISVKETPPTPAPASDTTPPAETRDEPKTTAPTGPKIVVPLPDPRIQAFVDNVRVAGIRSSGSESKVLMNDRVYRVNDLVDRTLGIKLIKVEPETLTFADANGVTYTRTF